MTRAERLKEIEDAHAIHCGQRRCEECWLLSQLALADAVVEVARKLDSTKGPEGWAFCRVLTAYDDAGGD